MNVMLAIFIVLSLIAPQASQVEDCNEMNLGDNWSKGLSTELQTDCFNLNNIDCSDVSYPKDIKTTVEIMKFCTGGEKEVQ